MQTAKAVRPTKDVQPDQMIIINGRTYKVTKVFVSNNSFIIYGRNGENGDHEVIKVYGETREIPIEQSGNILRNLVTYAERLRNDGVAVATIENDSLNIVVNEETGKFNIILQTPFLGESFENLILQAKTQAECLCLLRSILKSLGKLLTNCKGPRLAHGVDLIPRNFVGNGSRHAIYVDLMPPKIIASGKYLLEWPEVTDPVTRRIGIYRHYDKVGIMQVLLVQMGKLRPEFYDVFAREIERYLEKIGEAQTLHKFRARRCRTRITGTRSDVEKINHLTFSHIYDLREIACYYSCIGLMSKEELNEFFNLSHFQDKPIDSETLARLRTMLSTAINRRDAIEQRWNTVMANALATLGGTIRHRETYPYALERVSLARFKRNICTEGVRIIIISGPTGVGKSFIARGLEENGIERIPNVFTRIMRPGERPGIDFIHMSEEEFASAEKSGAFLVTNERHGYHHGLLKRLVEGAHSSAQLSYMDKSVPSTTQLLAHPAMKLIPCLLVYILPPHPGELVRRITERSHRIGQSTNENIQERLDTSLAEFPSSVGSYDLFLVHEVDSNRAVKRILKALGRG